MFDVTEPEVFTISGMAGFGDADNLAGATLALFETRTAQRVLNREGVFDSISVLGEEGIEPEALRERIQRCCPPRGGGHELVGGRGAVRRR